MSPPLSKDAAPLDPETLSTLRAEINKRGMNADRLRKRLVPPVSGATFWRAIHGQKVSKPVQDACAAMARIVRDQGHSRITITEAGREIGLTEEKAAEMFALIEQNGPEVA